MRKIEDYLYFIFCKRRINHKVPFIAHIIPEKNKFNVKNAMQEAYSPIVVNKAV